MHVLPSLGAILHHFFRYIFGRIPSERSLRFAFLDGFAGDEPRSGWEIARSIESGVRPAISTERIERTVGKLEAEGLVELKPSSHPDFPGLLRYSYVTTPKGLAELEILSRDH